MSAAPATIECVRAGPLLTVQDLGRPGLRHLGITAGGALDPVSLRLANWLVGNPAGAAALEFGFPHATLRFHADGVFALTGADAEATLDAAPVRVWWRYRARAGQTLTITPAAGAGGLLYLAVGGGIAVPEVLGARATDVESALGGIDGRPLRRGDVLVFGETPAGLGERPVGIRPPPWAEVDRASEVLALRVLPGPEYPSFTVESQRRFWETEWTVSPQSGRMAFRLQGPEGVALTRRKDRADELLSHGVLPGVVQVPPAGLPIALMAEAQTTGGYPKIGVVASADLPRLAQARPGRRLRFVTCTLDEAREALAAQARYLEQMQAALARRA